MSLIEANTEKLMAFTNLPQMERVNSLLEKAYVGRTSDLSKSIALSKEALQMSRDLEDQLLIGNSLNKLGLFYMIISDFEKSNAASSEAITCFKAIKNERGIADAKYTLGSVLYKSDNHHKGLYYLLEAMTIYKTYDDFSNLSKVEKAIGTIYEYLGDTINAFKAYKSAIKNARKINDTNLESNVFNNLYWFSTKKRQVKNCDENDHLFSKIKTGKWRYKRLWFCPLRSGKSIFIH
ncbi:hypothetical protein N7U66_06675 [Lacinutrix neustonica]|uniref:Tetratricopeptide repeat protein n=1 Tax=Lacinutrix neustonica TaxID=2980107 RepID=A0A9E8MXM2_9FLAO|nr:tetratricopeptide repeat protein [Lacinutrix neustonica]WAC03251.1 hypothetical protein N7U66_06675 [Lacinutrix neustonica]